MGHRTYWRRHFNPRPLAGATPSGLYSTAFQIISIHAPLRGRPLNSFISISELDFNPRPLAGATYLCFCPSSVSVFQSTPPCGGDIQCLDDVRIIDSISIHAPLRGRHLETDNPRKIADISIHAPLRGRQGQYFNILPFLIFQSTPPCGGDLSRI